MRKFKTLLLCALLLITCFQFFPSSPLVANAEPRTIKVAFPTVDGYSEWNENGQPYGLVVDFLKEISNYTGWKYEYCDVSIDDLFDNFRDGKYDLMGGNFYSEDWKDSYGYPDYNCGRSKSVLLARWDDASVKIFDEKTLNGKIIGVYEKADESKRRLNDFLKLNGVTCEIKEYTKEQLDIDGNLYRYLENGEVDLLLGNIADLGKGFRAIVEFDGQPHYIVTRPEDTALLAQLNEALGKLYDTNPDFAEEAYDANFSDLVNANIILNAEEKTFIKNNPVMRVSMPSSFYPIYVNDGGHKGILPDILNRISEKTGLQFTYVFASSYAESLNYLREGKVDIMGMFLDNRDAADEEGFALTQSYSTLNSTLMRNKKASYPASDLTIAMVEGRQVPLGITADNYIYFPTFTEALRAVNNGKADIAYGISALIEKNIQDNNFSNILPVSIVNRKGQVRFAVEKPAVTPLFTILNKAVNMIGEEELEKVTNSNIESVGIRNYSFNDFVYANPVAFISIFISIIALLFVIVFLVVSMRYRSAKMKLELEKSNADSRAKSEFLSRMSHEIRTPMNAIIGLTDLTGRQTNVPANVKKNLDKINSSSHYLLGLLNDVLDMSKIESGMLVVRHEPFALSKMLNEIQSMMRAEAERRGVELTVISNCVSDMFSGDVLRLKQVLTNLVFNAVKFTPSGGQVELSVEEDARDGLSALSFAVKDNGAGIAPEDKERIFKAFEQAENGRNKSEGTGLGLAISQNIVRLMGGDLNLDSEKGKGSTFYFTIELAHSQKPELKAVVPDNMRLEGMRVLMAEDNDLNAEIVQEIIEMAGAEVTWAADGKQALEAFASRPEHYHAILMDINMPIMNGLDATKAIRNLDVPEAKRVIIIAMTANSFAEDVETAKEAGMNDFIAKPFDTEILYTALYNAFNHETE